MEQISNTPLEAIPADGNGVRWINLMTSGAAALAHRFVDCLEFYTSSETAVPWLYPSLEAPAQRVYGFRRPVDGALSYRGSAPIEYLFEERVFNELFCQEANGQHLVQLLELRGHVRREVVNLPGKQGAAVLVVLPSLFADHFEVQVHDEPEVLLRPGSGLKPSRAAVALSLAAVAVGRRDSEHDAGNFERHQLAEVATALGQTIPDVPSALAAAQLGVAHAFRGDFTETRREAWVCAAVVELLNG